MKRLSTSDARIAYSDDGEGPAVLLLHGSFSPDWLAPAGRRLAGDGYRVLRPHRAGYGQSEDLTDDGASVAAHAEHAVQVMLDAGPPERASSGSGGRSASSRPSRAC
ncbi:MAG TPA: hypothetical protein VMG38_03745 [Trebonia sp.]|nr:hypothetical protein [Trebonia sp.]